MQGDTFHTLDEFPNFPWDKALDKNAGFGRGGIHQGPNGTSLDLNGPPYKPFFSFIREDSTTDVWQVPISLLQLLAISELQGAEKAQRQMRQAIGVER